MSTDFISGRWLVRILILIGIAFAFDAILKVLNPPTPTVGRFRGLTDLAIALFGPAGIAASSTLASIACFYLARRFWRSTSRRPNERLWS